VNAPPTDGEKAANKNRGAKAAEWEAESDGDDIPFDASDSDDDFPALVGANNNSGGDSVRPMA